jgi:hypothetical protein
MLMAIESGKITQINRGVSRQEKRRAERIIVRHMMKAASRTDGESIGSSPRQKFSRIKIISLGAHHMHPHSINVWIVAAVNEGAKMKQSAKKS